jgi:hypothetical protein
VFSLNTVAGFACSIGVDMGYNKSHHEHGESATAQKTATQSDGHQHKHTSTPSDGKKDHNNTKDDHDCCTNGVADFIKLDKSVTSSGELRPPVFIVAFVSQFLLSPKEPSLFDTSLYGSLRRSRCSTDDTDLRIVIQSFQI